MRDHRVVIVGAGIAGLSAAMALAAAGMDVTVLERAAMPGGKIRQIAIGGARIDSGPTVFTMRWVFDELFAQVGLNFGDHVRLRPLAVLARHAWDDVARLDLFADEARMVAAIGDFAGAFDAARYRAFCRDTKRIYHMLERPFLRASRPSLAALLAAGGLRRLPQLVAIRPFTTMAGALAQSFRDPRLRQLFGRYATYCGSSPYAAPATLMLIAHVEREGVWSVDGGMQAVAQTAADAATSLGARIRYGCEVAEITTAHGRVASAVLATGERIAADAVIVNADVAAVAGGSFGTTIRSAVPAMPASARSLSAVTWSMTARTRGFPLSRHNVFFARDGADEFSAIFARGTMPPEPTVYVCAQDRDDGGVGMAADERLLVLINAPADGDRTPYDATEIKRCAQATFGVLERCGLTISAPPAQMQVTTPADFAALFPATGGALYGRNAHGWTACFRRPGVRTRISGLYLAGGSAHPGPGVPMAALSGRAAAACLLADLTSRAMSRTAAMRGGISTG